MDLVLSDKQNNWEKQENAQGQGKRTIWSQTHEHNREGVEFGS